MNTTWPSVCHSSLCNFMFHRPATTEIYTLSLHDALPISLLLISAEVQSNDAAHLLPPSATLERRKDNRICTTWRDRKSTRLNSSHANISYAVFCLKKRKKKQGRDCGTTQRVLGGSSALHG